MKNLPPSEDSFKPMFPGDAVNPTSRGYGAVSELLTTFQESGFKFKDFFDQWDVDNYISLEVRQRVASALFRVVEGDSIATDLSVEVPGNLVDQKAAVQGIDVVKVHFNLINSFESVFNKTKTQDEINKLVWFWEIGRYAGLQLHKQAVYTQWPIGFPRNFKAKEFWGQLTADLFPDRELPKELPEEGIIDHFTIALPERIASTVGYCMLIHSGLAESNQLDHLNKNLRLRALRPIRNAQEFGITSGTASLYEIGSVSPFDSEGFTEYLEYVKDSTSIKFLADRAK